MATNRIGDFVGPGSEDDADKTRARLAGKTVKREELRKEASDFLYKVLAKSVTVDAGYLAAKILVDDAVERHREATKRINGP